MKYIAYFYIFLFISCSHFNYSTKLSASKNSFKFKDKSSEYNFLRTTKIKDDKFISKSSMGPLLRKELNLEKTISISKMQVKGQENYLIPKISQYTVWLEKKKYFSQMKLDHKNKKIEILMNGHEKKWSGKKVINLPQADLTCFFSQIPECLKYHGLLNPRPDSVSLLVIWDNYPYHSEIYSNMNPNAYELATIEYSGKMKGLKKFTLNLSNQMIFYLFNNENEFEKMFWIAQGITLVKQDKNVR